MNQHEAYLPSRSQLDDHRSYAEVEHNGPYGCVRGGPIELLRRAQSKIERFLGIVPMCSLPARLFPRVASLATRYRGLAQRQVTTRPKWTDH
jgi:hypothetical protein